jgi:hypothetical protein
LSGTVTTIQLSAETRDELREFGKKGESYDMVIHKLMDVAKRVAFFEEIDHIVETEEFVPLDKI